MVTNSGYSEFLKALATLLAIVLPLVYVFLIRIKRQKLFPEIPIVESSDERHISVIPRINPPKMNGTKLAITCWCVKHIWFFRYLASKEIPKQLNFDKFLQRRIADSIKFMPYEDYPVDRLPPSLSGSDSVEFSSHQHDKNDITWLENLVDEKVHVNDRATCLHYHKAYKDGTTTPSDVAEIVIENIRKLADYKPHLNIITQYNTQDIREQAAASTERYKSGSPLSLMDGVPMAIKDFLKVKGYRLTHGTSFENVDKKCDSDSNEVKRLKNAGAVIIGIASAHECGLGATGAAVNRVNKACRNAINVNYMAGGSSGGSAAAVGSGLCPVAIGSDGGGSIRIPSSFNGLVGVKSTFNRIFHEPLRATLAVSGPLCWTTSDALLSYHYLNGSSITNTRLENQFHPPKSVFRPDFPSLFQEGKLPKGFKIGIDRNFIKQAFDTKVAACCLGVADMLKEHKGAELVEISIPELFEGFVAFTIIFGSEGGFYSYWGHLDHYQDEYSPNLFLQSAFTNALTLPQYLLACQQKSRMCKFMRELFGQVDVIMLPTTGSRALELKPGDLAYGRLDTGADLEIARFTWLANLVGIPSITVPLFWDTMTGSSPKKGPEDVLEMPCAVQMMASWWREDNSFLATRAVEKLRNDLIEEQETKQQASKARVDYMLNVNSLPR